MITVSLNVKLMDFLTPSLSCIGVTVPKRNIENHLILEIFNLQRYQCPQRAKNTVSASALLTRKNMRFRKIFSRMVYNVSLKGQILSRQCKSHPDNLDGFKLFI